MLITCLSSVDLLHGIVAMKVIWQEGERDNGHEVLQQQLNDCSICEEVYLVLVIRDPSERASFEIAKFLSKKKKRRHCFRILLCST